MRNSYFVAAIIAAIILAKLEPSIGKQGGILRPEITVSYIALFTIFFNSGLTLPTEELRRAMFQWRLHVFVQSFTFVVVPLMMVALVSVLKHTSMDANLLDGLKILSTMPPPVSSAITITKAVGGNEAAAIFNSAFGSLLGIFVTPALILSMIDAPDDSASSLEVPTNQIVSHLMLTAMLPLCLAQVIRRFCYRRLVSLNIPYKTVGCCTILYILYTTFCQAFSSHTAVALSVSSLVACGGLIVGLQLCTMTLLLHLSSSLCLSPPDSITVMYCGTHKSLTLGIPLIEIIFKEDPRLMGLSVPLLAYNPVQIVLGALSVPYMSQWLEGRMRRRRKFLKHV